MGKDKKINDDFEQLKKEITEIPCLTHFDPKKDNFITTRCGRFSHDDLCDTHKRIRSEQQGQSTSADKTMPTMPIERAEVRPDITVISDSQSSHADELPSTANIDPELTVTAEIKYDAAVKPTEETRDSETPTISPPVDCSTEKTKQRSATDFDNTPTGSPQKTHMSPNRGVVELNFDGGNIENKVGEKGIRISDRIKSAKRVVKMGGIEYF